MGRYGPGLTVDGGAPTLKLVFSLQNWCFWEAGWYNIDIASDKLMITYYLVPLLDYKPYFMCVERDFEI